MIFHTIHICKSVTKVFTTWQGWVPKGTKRGLFRMLPKYRFGEIHFFAQEFPDKSRGFNFQMGP